MTNQTIELKLTVTEINAILEMIDKTQVRGVNSMRVLLGIEGKIQQAIQESKK